MNINEVVTFFTGIPSEYRKKVSYGEYKHNFLMSDIGLKITVIDLGGGCFTSFWDRSTCNFNNIGIVEINGIKAIRFWNNGFIVSGVTLKKMV